MLKLLFIIIGMVNIISGVMILNGNYEPTTLSVGITYMALGILFCANN